MVAWIAEPADYAGIVVPTVLAACVWYWLCRQKERDTTG
jgi:hypothetical protein